MESVEYEEHNFINPFMHPTVYRGPPTNELEWQWERLWNRRSTPAPVYKK